MGGANVEELLSILKQLDKEQRRRILEFIKSLLMGNTGCRSWLIALVFSASLIN